MTGEKPQDNPIEMMEAVLYERSRIFIAANEKYFKRLFIKAHEGIMADIQATFPNASDDEKNCVMITIINMIHRSKEINLQSQIDAMKVVTKIEPS